MDIKYYHTRGQARRIVSWRKLIDTVDTTPAEHLWFTPGALKAFNTTFVGKPFVQPYSEETYWVERHVIPAYGEEDTDTVEFVIYGLADGRITRVGEHEDATVALGSAMFLAAV